MGAGDTAPDVVDYGVIPIANLDVTPATATVAGSQTTWAGIKATLTSEFSAPTQYPTGAPLDPVSFTYTGDGGKPDFSQEWTPPETIALSEAARWTQVGVVTGLHVDDQNHLLHVVRTPNAAQGGHV